jgi:hypothetical protein
MLLRWLSIFVLVTIVHAWASFVVLVLAVATAPYSGGPLSLPANLFCILFSPLLLLSWVGVELIRLDSPAGIAINSLSWAVAFSMLWLVGSRLRRKERQQDTLHQQSERDWVSTRLMPMIAYGTTAGGLLGLLVAWDCTYGFHLPVAKAIHLAFEITLSGLLFGFLTSWSIGCYLGIIHYIRTQ